MIPKKYSFGRLIYKSTLKWKCEPFLVKLIEQGKTNSFQLSHFICFFMLIFLVTTNIGCAEKLRSPDSTSAKHASGKSKRSQIATVGALTLKINDCVLRAHSSETDNVYKIILPGNCRFVVKKDGNPQIIETPAGQTLLVASSFSLPNSRFCDTRVRAIVIKNYNVLISENEQRIRTCSGGPFDTKMFFVLANKIRVP